MAINNPVDGQLVKEYDTQQTVELNKNKTDIMAIEDEIGTLTGKVDDLETKVGGQSIVGSILYRLGLIKDYVVEYGSNANGSYEKWESGKLVQTVEFVATNGTTQAQGGIFRSAVVQTVDFPIPFLNASTTNLLSLQSNGNGAYGTQYNTHTNTSFNFRLVHYINQMVNTPCVAVFKGRWK